MPAAQQGRGTILATIADFTRANAPLALHIGGRGNNRICCRGITANRAMDAVHEFGVQSNTMPADFGLTLGGVVNVVTEARSNNVHGVLKEFVCNSAFHARNTFSKAKPAFIDRRYGSSPGGPVVHSELYTGEARTFLFGDGGEYHCARGSLSINKVTAPAQPAGNCSKAFDAWGRLMAAETRVRLSEQFVRRATRASCSSV